jgi:hypothetical protein
MGPHDGARWPPAASTGAPAAAPPHAGARAPLRRRRGPLKGVAPSRRAPPAHVAASARFLASSDRCFRPDVGAALVCAVAAASTIAVRHGGARGAGVPPCRRARGAGPAPRVDD